MEFSGRLSSFPMPDLLQWARNEAVTGALVVRRSHREKRIFLTRGNVVACFSDDPAEYFGRYLVLHGYVSVREVTFALTFCQRRRVRLGVALRELGLLAEETIQQTLRQQIEDSICDLFLWRRGVFYFIDEMPPDEDLLPEAIDTFRLVLEGTRWVDEYRRIRQVFEHDSFVLHSRRSEHPDDALSPLQQRIIQTVDGILTLGEVYQRIQGSYFRFLESGFELAMREIVDIEERAGEDELEPSREIGIYDLLLEQATEEQGALFRRRLGLSVDLLEQLYPVWIRRPSKAALDLLPTDAAAVLGRIDGSVALGELIGEPGEAGDDGAEAIAVQLRQGALALLPCPPDRIAIDEDDTADWVRYLRAGR